MRDPDLYRERRAGSLHLFERQDVIAAKVRALPVPLRPGAKAVPAMWGPISVQMARVEGMEVARVAEFENGRVVLLPNLLTVALREGTSWGVKELGEVLASEGFVVSRHLFGRAFTVRREVPSHELTDPFGDAETLRAKIPEIAHVEPVVLEEIRGREAFGGTRAG